MGCELGFTGHAFCRSICLKPSERLITVSLRELGSRACKAFHSRDADRG